MKRVCCHHEYPTDPHEEQHALDGPDNRPDWSTDHLRDDHRGWPPPLASCHPELFPRGLDCSEHRRMHGRASLLLPLASCLLHPRYAPDKLLVDLANLIDHCARAGYRLTYRASRVSASLQYHGIQPALAIPDHG